MDLREPTQLGSRRQPRASCSGNAFTDSSMLWDPCNKNGIEKATTKADRHGQTSGVPPREEGGGGGYL
ncbi:hypothetical protein NC651_034604 [Populus alba x Populus x berolinensis]|nr:hypothetical protein NC651_034604 [Populus alba x Populus x berolinensis]